MNTNGTMHMTQLSPPSSEHAPAIPRRANIGADAKGSTVASSEREHEAAALAEAA